MSRDQHLSIVRRWTDAINAREVPEEILSADFEMENVVTAVTDRLYFGARGFRDWIYDFFDVMDEGARFEGEPTDVGEDYVVGKLAIRGRGAASGAPVDMEYWGVMWIRDGKVTRAVGYATRREALRAVGLSE